MKAKLFLAMLLLVGSFVAKAQSVTVLYPNGINDTLYTGTYETITWTPGTDSTKRMLIEFYSNISLNWVVLDSVGDDGVYKFYMPQVPPQLGKIRITRMSNPSETDESDDLFVVANPSFTVSTINDDTICVGNFVRLESMVSGGLPNYTVQWHPAIGLNNPNDFHPIASPTTTTTYTIVVTDDAGRVDSDKVTIMVRPDVAPEVTGITVAQPITCYGMGDGELCATVANGLAPYEYYWRGNPDSGAPGAACVGNLYSSSYYLVVKDANGCFSNYPSQPYILSAPQPVNASIQYIGDQNYPDTLLVNATGGTSPYLYTWSNSTTTQHTEIFSAGNYNVTITDFRGCTGIADFTTSQYYAQSDTFKFCSNYHLGGTATLCVLDNDLYTTGDSLVIDSLAGLPLGVTYSIVGGSNNKCIRLAGLENYSAPFYFSYSAHSLPNHISSYTSVFVGYDNTITCVWPGDANYDGVVNNADLLPIGLHYLENGYLRPEPGIAWKPYSAFEWNDTLNDSTNLKHVDCNGSGQISAADTLAITNNYTLTHPRSGGPATPRANVPWLNVALSTDTLVDGQTVVANISLGDASQQATDVYGIAFSFNYDPLVIDTSMIGFNVSNNSWLCNNTGDHISIRKKLISAGKLDVAISRLDKTTRTGGGEIAQAILKITTGNINGKDLSYYGLNCYISNATLINNKGNKLEVNEGIDSAVIEFTPLSIREAQLNNKLLLYPNPTATELNFNLQEGVIEEWEITAADGKVVLHSSSQANIAVADVSTLAKGVYIMRAKAKAVWTHNRFIKE